MHGFPASPEPGPTTRFCESFAGELPRTELARLIGMRTEPTWSRNQLWAEHDARTARRNRRRSLAVSIGCSTLWLGLTVTSYSWRGIPLSEPNPPTAECRVHGDCVLLPSVVNCCGECGPAAPYEAAPRDVLDLLRRATDESCAPTTRVCDP